MKLASYNLAINPPVTGGNSAALPTQRITLAPATKVGIALGGALFLTMLPVTMMVPVLKELVATRFGVGPFWVHLFMSINLIGGVLTAPLSAAIADRASRRAAVLLAALLLNGTILALMPLTTDFATFMLLRFLEGAFHMAAISTIMACAGDWAPPERRGRQMGMIGAALIFGTACGAPLGGAIGQRFPLMVFGIGLAAVLAAALIVAFVPESVERRRVSRLAEIVSALREHRGLITPYAFAFADRLCVGLTVSSFILFLSDVHHYSPAARGGLLALNLFPFAVLCYPVGRLADRWGRKIPIIVGNAAYGIVFALYGVVPASWLGTLMLASGVCSALMFTPSLTMCADRAPAAQRATVYAGFNVAGSIGFMCGPLIGGTIHAFAGDMPIESAYRLSFLVGGAAPLICAAVFTLFAWRNRDAHSDESKAISHAVR